MLWLVYILLANSSTEESLSRLCKNARAACVSYWRSGSLVCRVPSSSSAKFRRRGLVLSEQAAHGGLAQTPIRFMSGPMAVRTKVLGVS